LENRKKRTTMHLEVLYMMRRGVTVRTGGGDSLPTVKGDQLKTTRWPSRKDQIKC